MSKYFIISDDYRKGWRKFMYLFEPKNCKNCNSKIGGRFTLIERCNSCEDDMLNEYMENNNDE